MGTMGFVNENVYRFAVNVNDNTLSSFAFTFAFASFCPQMAVAG